MKRLIYVACFLLTSYTSLAQVGIGTTTPDPSASLEINSTNSGILIPRLSDSQRDAISNPATGLLIFNTSSNTFQYNFGSPGTPNWYTLNNQNATTLQDIRGLVNASGTYTVNTGATITKTGTGIYRVDFTNPAPNNMYSVIATPERASGTDDIFVGISNRTNSSFEIRISDEDDGGTTSNYIDNGFSFHVVFYPSGGSVVSTNASEYGYVTGVTGSAATQGVTVTKNSTGHFTITFNTPKSNTNYIVNATVDRTSGQDDTFIGVSNRTVNSFDIYISNEDDGSTTDYYFDSDFSFVVF